MSHPCVLCISSDPSTADRLRESLRPLDLCIHAASCAKEAIEVLRIEHVRLVIVDPSPNPSLPDGTHDAPAPDPTTLVPIVHAECPSVPVIVASGQFTADAAAALLTHAGEGPAGYDELLIRSRSSIATGHWPEARALASRALGLNPSRAEALNLLGAILDLQTLPHQATNYYRAAIAIDPSYRPAHRNLFRHGDGLTNSAIELGELAVGGREEHARAGSARG